ncbi:MAG: hypothetical protein FWF53_09240 [Candidatus Azobacteroides sp.]|nr:hypothetical protein [Candidatus Azobacteroides sp.]
MKKKRLFIIVFICIAIVSGCGTSKKIQSEIKETQSVNERTTEHAVIETTKSIDTTKVSSVESNTFKVDFFNPSEVEDYAAVLQLMKERGEPFSEYGIVKSVLGSITKTNETQSGITEEAGKTTIDTEKANNSETKKEEKMVVKTEPFFAKFKGYLIVTGVILIGIGVLFIAKKSGFFQKILMIVYKFVKK